MNMRPWAQSKRGIIKLRLDSSWSVMAHGDARDGK